MLRPALTAPALATLTLVALSGCQTAPPARPAPPTDPDVVGESRTGSGYLKGYLDRKQLPDSLALLPRPPAEGSAEAAADLAVHRATRALRNDGSHPSGHSALGWAWALVLTGIAPDRADALLQRGHAFGQSRVVCGVHWQSDVAAGRLVASATYARLQSDPVFQAQRTLARKELAAARAQP